MAGQGKARVICVGAAVVDTIFLVDRLPLAPGKNFARGVKRIGGGIAANAAVTVTALGGEGVLWSRVGDDPTGAEIVAELAAWRVDVHGVQRVSGLGSPVSTVLLDPAGERQIVNFLDPRLFADARAVPFAGIDAADAVLCDPRWLPATLPVLAAARARGLPAVVDVEAVPEQGIEAVLDVASHVVFARDGLARLAATDEISAGLRRLAMRTDAFLAVTCGGAGVYWLEDQAVRHLPAYPVEVVDTLAAGDVFHGAFALALAERRPAAAALRFASAAAAVKCTRFGGREGIPDRAAVERLMEENG